MQCGGGKGFSSGVHVWHLPKDASNYMGCIQREWQRLASHLAKTVNCDLRNGQASTGKRGGGAIHADLGLQQVARVVDLDAVAGFVARHGGVPGVFAEGFVPEGKPRHGGDDAGFNLAAGEQVAQARFDKDAVARPHAAGVEGGEEERADHAADYTGGMPGGMPRGCRLAGAEFLADALRGCAFVIFLRRYRVELSLRPACRF